MFKFMRIKSDMSLSSGTMLTIVIVTKLNLIILRASNGIRSLHGFNIPKRRNDQRREVKKKSFYTQIRQKLQGNSARTTETSGRFCTVRSRFQSHVLVLLHIQFTRFGE